MITKILAPVYAKTSYGTYRTIPRVHLVEVELWKDAAGNHRAPRKKALCGVNAGSTGEMDSKTPVTCPACGHAKRLREAAPETSSCKACRTGKGRHTCGLAGLQDTMTIGRTR
jgi:hypothetical protein